MARFSANLGFLFADRPLPERVRAAARAGFPAVEMHWPYDVPADQIGRAAKESGVAVLGLNTPIGESAAGEFGLGAIPGRETDFQKSVDQCLAYAEAIGANALHCMAGVTTGDLAAAERTFVQNLRTAADKAVRVNVTILIEPINHRDRPNYVLQRTDQGARIIDQVGRGNVRIMFDCYHVQITEGDLSRRIEQYLPLIGHVQIAAVPSRAEPDEGEVNYPAILNLLDALGYAGYVGAEYKPRGRTEDGLRWLSQWSEPPRPAGQRSPDGAAPVS